MTLAAGTRLGPYEILAPIGAGGMGEVYRARDTKLDRDVAIKVLPAALAQDPERLARFEREAKVLASLNHPNIAQIYGIEDRALVMELVEGQTLHGPLPLETALSYARQIADALEAAHEKNIIHRDLKPANIMITPAGVVKVLDFGLAAVAQSSDPSTPANSPTLTISPTRAGMILGTAAYMSPEQARGKAVDKRADIWAFGVVLFEMLSGKRLFEGETISDTLAQVLTKEPNWEQVPLKVRRLLRKCLEKDPKKRLRDIGDAWELLEEAEPAATAPSRSRLGMGIWVVAAAFLALVAAGASWIAYRATRPADLKPLVRLNLDLPSSTFALSPDGTRIVYLQPGTGGGAPLLATRLLADSNATILPGTENAALPFFSPDGQWIGFAANDQLQKVSVRGGAPVPLAAVAAFVGGSWGKDGSIIAPLNIAAPIMRIPDNGGLPEEVVRPDDAGPSGFMRPQYLPGGHAVLFTAIFNTGTAVYVKNLTTRKTQRLVDNVLIALYLPTGGSTGHIAYLSQGTLFARPFDPSRLVFLGPPQPVLSDVATNSGGGASLSFSETGNFLYEIGQAGQQVWPVQWMDSSGATRPLLNTEGAYSQPRFSPDPAGQFLALVKGGGTGLGEVLVYDWKNDVIVTLTRPGKPGGFPMWSPDGRHLAMSDGKSIVWMRADGSGEPRRILEGKSRLALGSISQDGRFLAFMEPGPETLLDIWVAPLDLSKPDQPVLGKPELVVGSRGNDSFPAFSPDGKWLAYYSDESGRFEVYVRPFPGPGAARNVSVEGGVFPAWSSNGHKLLFTELRGMDFGNIMAVDYRVSGDAFLAARPRVWSNARYRRVGAMPVWALHPDGKRIAMFPPEAAAENAGGPRFGFLLNFFDEVRRRAPVEKK
jgi:serine/threonine-protein kinase